MPVNRVQTLRSSTKKQRPAVGSQEPGSLFVNFSDLQLGVIDAGKNPLDLIAFRFFSAVTDYVAGDFVVNLGTAYRAKGAISAGAFNASQWDVVSTAADLSGKENTIAAGTTSQYWRGDKSWQALDKSAVGLANVDNTSDANKPVSSPQSAALAFKVDKTGDTMSGHLALPTGPGPTNAVRKDYVDTATGSITTAVNLKADLASPTFTGDPKAPTPSPGDNDTSIATTAFITNALSLIVGGAVIGDTPPVSPKAGQLWWESDTGNTFIWYDDGNTSQWIQINSSASATATAETRNRIVNGAMQISQENGNASGLMGNFYAADQWYVNNATGILVGNSQQVQVVTPNGSANRFRTTITTGGGAGSGNCMIVTKLEGIRMADFRYGSASTKQSVLRFGWKSPAGTYSISLRNSGINRSFIATFTVSAGQANTDTEQIIVIPGDVTGTWLTDTGLGVQIGFVLTATPTGVAGWQAGNFLATASNTIATNAVFELFDVGLYLDPQNSGTPPAWQMPDEAQEMTACQRYFQWAGFNYGFFQTAGSENHWVQQPLLCRMRTLPAASTIAADPEAGGASALNNAANTLTGMNPYTYRINLTGTASATVNVQVFNYRAAMNARM